jgi:hypothetical protein
MTRKSLHMTHFLSNIFHPLLVGSADAETPYAQGESAFLKR